MSDPGSTGPQFVLASGSPRRAEILERLEVAFDVLAADTDETRRPDEDPTDYVTRVAREKARVVMARRRGEIIVAADTTVVLDGEPLGKPHTPEAAQAMLGRLLGRSHQVLTGVCVVDGDGTRNRSRRFRHRHHGHTPTSGRWRGTSRPASRSTRPAPTRSRVSAPSSSSP